VVARPEIREKLEVVRRSGGRATMNAEDGAGSHGDLTYASHGAGSDSHGANEGIAVRRRHERWSAGDKARITAESFAPGASIAAVARRNGVSLGLLHHWRRKVRDSGRVEELRFMPVAVADEASSATPGSIEIALGDVRICVRGAIDAGALRTVLAAVRT
jgi:transposase